MTAEAADADSAWENFVPPPDDEFDWIQLTSGEWLKGELKVLYNFEIEFDSDELDLQTFDLEDVKRIRTHKPQSLLVEDTSPDKQLIVVEGILTLIDNKVLLTMGDTTKEFERSQMVSIAPANKKERSLWAASVTLGANFRGGNTDTVDINLRAKAKRRTASSRLELDYSGNYSEAERVETSNNHRVSGFRDTYISKTLFWRQLLAEYHRDRFKNIANQLSLTSSIGYHLVRTPKTEWDVATGLGAMYTEYESVAVGQSTSNTSPAFGAGTSYDTELTKWMDFIVEYGFQIVDKESGSYTHHFVNTISTDLMEDIDLDISFVWDRIKEPRPDSGGVVPEKDDYQLIVGFSLDY